MSNFKISIDGKSFLFGLIFSFCFIILSGFDGPAKSQTHDFQTGKYYTTGLNGKEIILDTETGEFVLISFGMQPNMYKFRFEDIPLKPMKTRNK